MNPVAESGSQLSFLACGGEMGRRMREFDWSQHPLGPPEAWPNSLKFVVQLMLRSRFAMWMGWGPEFYFFWNDAYTPTLGIKAEHALGLSASKVWAEIWSDVGPRAESVVHTGEATWDESLLLFLKRSGEAEETYHTFSYSPVPHDDGSIGGMLCVVTEETERVIGARRLALLRDLGSDLASIKAEDEVCRVVTARLGEQPQDLPFAMVYLRAADGTGAYLAAVHGTVAGTSLAPEFITEDEAADWPIREVFRQGAPMLVNDLAAHFDGLPTTPWGAPPQHALLVPIAQQGQGLPAGCLIAGLNPYRPLDTGYRGFLDLLAAQIAAGIASARAYAAERQRAAALEEIDHAKTAFFSNVSHEFRTPLTLMLGPLSELVENASGRLPAADLALAEVAQRNGTRLLKLVNSLLDFSRMEAGRVTACFEPTDLAAYTAELASSFRSAMDKAGLDFVVDCPVLPEPVFLDREMWEKVVLNLISNAFKFTLHGEVRLNVRAHQDGVEMTVSDTGAGISAEGQPHLFERFYRVQGVAARTHEGSGIGLALVAELVKAHGGSVRVESEIGCGSAFIVTLPLGCAHLPPEQCAAASSSPGNGTLANTFIAEALRWLPDATALDEVTLNHDGTEPETEAPRPRIILADDNADMRQYIARLLSKHFEVITVADGQAALDAALDVRPDLVLSDVMMPCLDGFGLLREMREDPALQSVPVILLSARAGEEARVAGLEAGADDYLTKPFHARELLAKVNSTLLLTRIRVEAAASEAELRAERTEILEGMDIAFLVLDAEYRISYLNHEAAHMLGLTPNQDMGREYWEALPASLGTQIETNYWYAMTSRTTVRFENFDASRQQWSEINAYPMSGGRLGVFFRDITVSKRAEAELQALAEQLRLIADTAPVLIAHCDREGRFKFVNEPYARRFGLRREEIIGRRIIEIVGVAVYESQREQIKRVLAGEPVEFEIIVPYEEEPHYLRYAYAPELNAAGEVVGLVAAIIDITDRKRVEDRLVEQSRLLDLSFDAIFVRDAQNRITYWNKGAEDSYGFTREEAVGRLKHELLNTEFPLPLEQIMAQLHRDGRWVGEMKHVRKDGSVVIDSTRWVLDHDAEGRSASILETNTDVTERRRAEAALQFSEKRYRSLIQSLPVAVYTCNREGRIQLYNAAAVELWGREPQLDQDLWCGSWRIYSADGSPLDHMCCSLARTVQDGLAVRGEEIIIERPDGTRRQVLPYPDPLFNAEGRVIGAVNMLLDITERKRAEMLLRDAKDAAELANQSKDRFLAVLSHELRTPLTPVLLTVAALEHDADLRPDLREDLLMIKRNIELETKLIDDLLDLSRITTGKLELAIDLVDLNEIVRQVCSICTPQLREQAVFLEVELDEALGMVAADPARLQQVLWNVLKNAIKFTPAKGTIQLSTARRQDGYCEVRVQDHGIGIPAERLPHVFNAFEQGGANITRQFGGLGLGLAICKALMELHHGAIRAESAGAGQGTTFIVELPSKSMSTTAKIRLTSPPEKLVLPPLRLLLVEDHADTARILCLQLRKAGGTVIHASDVQSAIQLLDSEQFDLVVTDLGLPDGSGYDIMHHIRETQSIPGIAMSGYGMEEDRRRSCEAGFAEHLVKPIDLRELIATIRLVTSE